jgi:hypothetical protein
MLENFASPFKNFIIRWFDILVYAVFKAILYLDPEKGA